MERRQKYTEMLFPGKQFQPISAATFLLSRFLSVALRGEKLSWKTACCEDEDDDDFSTWAKPGNLSYFVRCHFRPRPSSWTTSLNPCNNGPPLRQQQQRVDFPASRRSKTIFRANEVPIREGEEEIVMERLGGAVFSVEKQFRFFAAAAFCDVI